MNSESASSTLLERIARGVSLLLLAFGWPGWVAASGRFVELEDGIAVRFEGRELRVRICREDVLRVTYSPHEAFFSRDTLMTVDDACRDTAWELQERAESVELATSRVRARIDLETGAATFLDAAGNELLAARRNGGMRLVPAEVQGEETFHVQAEFEPGDEGLYGLGQHQNGWFDYSGRDVDLYQHNIVAVVPFLVSSRGYGLLWDNTSHTRFGDLRAPEPIPAAQLIDVGGEPGGLTGTYRQGDCGRGAVVAVRKDRGVAFGAPEDRPAISEIHNAVQATNEAIHPELGPGDVCVTWEGEIEAGPAGPYDLLTFANNGVRFWVDGELAIDTYRQGWLPWWDSVRRAWEEGSRHAVRLEWRKEDGDTTLRLKWKTPPRSPYTTLWSEVGEGVDYYFVYGPDLDDVVAGYRKLTGHAPLMPRWALGLWQSRERYETAGDSLEVLSEFRERRVPVDVIVQDWRYWRDGDWGSHAFDPERFPDPEGWIEALHERNARLMISVWPKFYEGTQNFEELRKEGFLYPGTLRRPTTDWLGYVHTFYDAFNAEAREAFWGQLDRLLFRKGIDAWWMDATEPELVGEGTPAALKAAMHPTAMGSGARMANAFALVSSRAIYEGQRSVAPDQRVFILTRSAFAGVQRYASATWSGDVASDWDSFRKQIPAGLNFSISGVPWWTTDIGGFSVPRKWARTDPDPADVEEWRELNTRWWQYSTFAPLLRSHGQYPRREPWFFGRPGERAYETIVAFDRLRYRLLPYTYTLASRVTHHHETMMRPLVMDFREDPEVRDIGDQFLLGPSLMVSPVTRRGATSRAVYLPRGSAWYDLWTGERLEGGRWIDAAAPLESIPIFVREGSIVPMGPELQYTGEKPADPLTLWVYTGADAGFELYEDDGVSYGYERGERSTIPLTWNEAERTLTLGDRVGSFPGMLEEREIRVVLVMPNRPIGHAPAPLASGIVTYAGARLVVPLTAETENSGKDEG